MRRPRLCRRSRSAARNSSPSGRPSNRKPETIEPRAGCNGVTRTPAGRAESATSLTELLAEDMLSEDILAEDILAENMGLFLPIDGAFFVEPRIKSTETVSSRASHAALARGPRACSREVAPRFSTVDAMRLDAMRR